MTAHRRRRRPLPSAGVAKRLRAIDELIGGTHLKRPGDLLAALTILRATRPAGD